MNEGTIITTSVNIPGVQHLGITIILNGTLHVIHNTPTRKNIFGGNIVVEPLNEFLIGRKITNQVHTYITTNFIVQRAFDVSAIKFDAYSFNCEHFIEYVTSFKINPKQAEQVKFNLAVTVLCSLLLI